MSRRGSLSQRIARRLSARASFALQEKRADWAQAMRNEFEYVPQGFAALRWSIGCLLVSYMERAKIMEIGNLKTARMSRVVLTLEMLLCFLMPTAALAGGLFMAVYLRGYPLYWSTTVSLLWSALLLTTSLVGPMGLFFAFKAIVLEQRRMSRRVTAVFCALAAWTCLGNTLFVMSVSSPGYELRGIVLLALLPLVGAAHLVYMANMERGTPAPA